MEAGTDYLEMMHDGLEKGTLGNWSWPLNYIKLHGGSTQLNAMNFMISWLNTSSNIPHCMALLYYKCTSPTFHIVCEKNDCCLLLSVHNQCNSLTLKAGNLKTLQCQWTGVCSGDLKVCCSDSENFEYDEQ